MVSQRWVLSLAVAGTWEGKRIGTQNRLEVRSLGNRCEGSYGAEVGRQGHPQNFVRSSIEENRSLGEGSSRWASARASRVSEVRRAGVRQLKGSVCEVTGVRR